MDNVPCSNSQIKVPKNEHILAVNVFLETGKQQQQQKDITEEGATKLSQNK